MGNETGLFQYLQLILLGTNKKPKKQMPGNLDNDDVIKQLPNDDQQEDEDEKDEKKQKQSLNEQVQNHKKMLEQYRLKEHEHETSMFEKSLQQVEIPFKGN